MSASLPLPDSTNGRLARIIRTSEQATLTLEEMRASMQASWAKGFLSDYSGISDYMAVEARAKVFALAARFAKHPLATADVSDLVEQAASAAMANGYGSSEVANAYNNRERSAWREVYNILTGSAF
jgi:hypothetical protein